MKTLLLPRPDATSNDGGQRTVYPGSRSPQTVDEFNQHEVHYDTGDMLRFAETESYSYALGDATKAYNNPTYNQAIDTNLTGNAAKVSRFQREFVYLRAGTPPPQMSQAGQSGEYLILFDRVGVTAEEYSGSNTKLLLHILGEPTVNGTATVIGPGETLYANANLATAISGNSKVFMRTLLPEAHNIRKVGGAAKNLSGPLMQITTGTGTRANRSRARSTNLKRSLMGSGDLS